MKIIVTKKEFADLVFQCRNCKEYDGCHNCVLNTTGCDGQGIEEFCDIESKQSLPQTFLYREVETAPVKQNRKLYNYDDGITCNTTNDDILNGNGLNSLEKR